MVRYYKKIFQLYTQKIIQTLIDNQFINYFKLEIIFLVGSYKQTIKFKIISVHIFCI